MIGERLAQARKDRGLTQTELAVEIGDRYNAPMISMVENGLANLLLEGAVNAARELGVSLDYLVGLTDEPTPAAQLLEQVKSLERAPIDPRSEADHLPKLAYVVTDDEPGFLTNEIVPLEIESLGFSTKWLQEQHIDPGKARVYRSFSYALHPQIQFGSAFLVDKASTELVEGRIYLVKHLSSLEIGRVRSHRDVWGLFKKYFPDDRMSRAFPISGSTEVWGEVRWWERTARKGPGTTR